ncbi:MAG: ABC transporter ATP-binding protein [Planctomycetota bacterium]|jgi:ABC-2 type transport system ATP-binding protein
MIEITNLRKYFPGVKAVDNITFQVGQGDIYGFIGPNGAGKTTTIRILATLSEPTSGKVYIDGLDCVNEPEKVRKVIGYMPDYFGVYEDVRVWEYLDFFASTYSIPRAVRKNRIEAVMELTDLVGIRDRMVADMSKGMRQRLCLAKTLLHEPKVLIMDEPAAGLDPRARIEIRELLKELASMGKTIFLSSHILTELSDLCNTVGIIEQGQLLATGDWKDIVKQISTAVCYCLKVASRSGDAVEILNGLETVSGVEAYNGDITFHYGGEQAKFFEVLRALVEREIPVTGLKQSDENLETLFMRITNGGVS